MTEYKTYVTGLYHTKKKLIHVLYDLGISCGTAVSSHQLCDEKFLSRNFRKLTPETQGKMETIRKTRDEWNFSHMDKICEFSRKHGLEVHWHCLAWNNYNPTWWEKLDRASQFSEMYVFVTETLKYITEKWGDVVTSVDILNEYFHESGVGYGAQLDKAGITPEYVFEWARNTGYSGLLFYNDFLMNESWQDAVMRRLVDTDLIDGVGLQMHLAPDIKIPDSLSGFVHKLSEKGKKIYITEADVCGSVEESEQIYYTLGRWIKQNQIQSLSFWGYKNSSSWLSTNPKCKSPLPWNDDLKPNQNYDALMRALKQ